MDAYSILYAAPDVQTYIALLVTSGLTPKTTQAATIGLSNTLFAVHITLSSSPNTVVGMGRIIDDGGCFFQVVDILVLHPYQGKGIGTMIMRELKVWMDQNVPQSGTVLLFADGPAKYLYQQFGFVQTSGLPISSVGMVCKY